MKSKKKKVSSDPDESFDYDQGFNLNEVYEHEQLSVVKGLTAKL